MRRVGCGLLVVCGFVTGCGLPLQPSIEAATVKEFSFSLVGPQTNITFNLPQSPAPDGYANQCAFNENTFCNVHVPVTVNGEVESLVTTFYGNGGMSLATGVTVPMIDLVGPQLFTGTPHTPTFIPGRYTLVTGNPRFVRNTYTLTVTEVNQK